MNTNNSVWFINTIPILKYGDLGVTVVVNAIKYYRTQTYCHGIIVNVEWVIQTQIKLNQNHYVY